MTRKQFKTALWVIGIVFLIMILVLSWLTWQAVAETEDWNFLDIDYTGKEGVINAYGALLSAILSFLAILFIFLDLLNQRRIDGLNEERQKNRLNSERLDLIEVLDIFLGALANDIESFGDRCRIFADKEKENYFAINRIAILPNTYPKLILGLDRTIVYNALKETGGLIEWKKIYVDLYRITDYYENSYDELTRKHQIHLDKKYTLSKQLADDLDVFLDMAVDLRNEVYRIEKKRGANPNTNSYFIFLDHIKNVAEDIVKRRKEAGGDPADEDYVDPSNFNVWDKELYQPAFKEILRLLNTSPDPRFNLESLMVKLQSLIRGVEMLEIDSKAYASHISTYSKNYYSSESKYFLRLQEMKGEFEKVIQN
ncbi:hypothetical protein [Robertkochia sediminum]|uniref:hypothetical protein n=1 Tax=Robertkochia sediminum TaxID=2785326 RepID=UPI00193438CE|nr:hypothetical protein [Robertkochia sediminum]MBL7473092.1 hypothetical protein [Robertkochia sediminum]